MAALFNVLFQEAHAPYANTGTAGGAWDVTTEYGTQEPVRDAEGLHIAPGTPQTGAGASYTLIGDATIEPALLTIQLWVRIESLYPGQKYLVLKANGQRPLSQWDVFYTLALEVGEGSPGIDPTSVSLIVHVAGNQLTVNVPLHEWVLYSVAVNNGHISVYVNGVERSGDDCGSIDYSGHGDWMLGGAFTDYSQYGPCGGRVDCTIGSLEVHDVALAPEAIAASAAAGPPTHPAPSPPVGRTGTRPRRAAPVPTTDYGTDFNSYPDLDWSTRIGGAEAVIQAIARSLEDAQIGVDIRSYLNAELSGADLYNLEETIKSRCLADERVQDATVQVTQPSRSELLVAIYLPLAEGPFKKTLSVTKLGVQLLTEA
jgi:hypothetical protein